MTFAASDFKLIYSGSSSVNQSTSIGGVISTQVSNMITSQGFTNPVYISGITIINAVGNNIGDGLLMWDGTVKSLTWKPYGGISFDGLVIVADGTYAIGTENGYLYITIVFASLPASSTQDTITISPALNNAFDDISKADSLYGQVDYRCFYLKNSHVALGASTVKIWLVGNTPGPDDISICLDPAAIGNGSTTGVAIGPLADTLDSSHLLTGLTFTQPSNILNALSIGTIPAGSCKAIWIKRTIAANNRLTYPVNSFSLGISAVT